MNLTDVQLVNLLAALAFVISAGGTWVLKRQFSGTSLMDQPNERSSHVIPRPRGGGLAIVIACLICWTLLHGDALLNFQTWFAYAIIGLLVGMVGFLDDQRLISLEFRLVTQIAAAVLGVTLLGGFPTLYLAGMPLNLGWGYEVLAVLFLVWCMNLFNFMDGIDGIAASEATMVAGAATILAVAAGLNSANVALPAIMAGAAAGFLIWNFPPAKIFMGSVGSEFLGYIMGLTAISLAHANERLFWAVVILVAVFVSDATLTLIMRFLSRENILRAHRTHAYQYLARRLGGHLPVTLGSIGVTLLWLAPIAVLVAAGRLAPIIGVAIAYAPISLFVVIYRVRRRMRDEQNAPTPPAA